MANTGFLATSELDFNTLKASFKQYLSGQAAFADYDFDGSNMSVLLDILSYNTYINNFYLNMVGSEMFLDTAQLRESVVSHSKELNYLPRSSTSAKSIVNVTIVPDDSPTNIVIPKFYKFYTEMDNKTYTFSTASETVVYPVSNTYTAANLEIYEGEVVTEYFTAYADRRYILQSENVDTNSIEVVVINSQYDSANSMWLRSDNLYGLTPTSNVYFLQGHSTNQYEIVFGNDVTGKSLNVGNIVKVTYRDTVGDTGNGAYAFSKGKDIDGYNTISVSTVISGTEGSTRESVDSIRFNAPRFFTTQERAVTSLDYANLTKQKFPQLQSVIAFGGEELSPPQYGKVGISVKPYGSSGLISDSLKANIVTYLNTKNITTQAIIIDPEYFYVGVSSKVIFNPALTTSSPAQIKAIVEQTIYNFGQTQLSEFGNDLRFSKLSSAIDNTDNSIIGNDTSLKIIKRWSPSVGVTSAINFTFDNQLYAETKLYELPQGHEQTFSSSAFVFTHTDGNDYSCYFGDNGLGQVHIFTNQVTAQGIIRTPLATNVGSVNYATGEVTLSASIASYNNSYISLYGIPKNKDMYAVKNKFLIIENSDMSVSVDQVVE